MGGRGTASLSSGSGTARGVATIGTATSSKEVADILRDKYGLDVDSSFESLELDRARNIAEGIDAVFDEFGDIPNFVRLSAGPTQGSILGQTHSHIDSDGNIASSIYMSSTAKDDGNNSMNGAKGTIAHELGHALAAHITNLEYSGKYERISAYNKNKVATSIMTKAINVIKKTEYGIGKTAQELRRGISPYAGHYKGGDGNAEAMAEAIDDFVINGKNANPLSLEVVKITKQRLGR